MSTCDQWTAVSLTCPPGQVSSHLILSGASNPSCTSGVRRRWSEQTLNSKGCKIEVNGTCKAPSVVPGLVEIHTNKEGNEWEHSHRQDAFLPEGGDLLEPGWEWTLLQRPTHANRLYVSLTKGGKHIEKKKEEISFFLSIIRNVVTHNWNGIVRHPISLWLSFLPCKMGGLSLIPRQRRELKKQDQKDWLQGPSLQEELMTQRDGTTLPRAPGREWR